MFIDLAKRLNVKHHEKPFTFSPDVIRYENKVFVLHQKLNCQVEIAENNYFITNLDFDINVWGTSKEEAEIAFSYTFNALFENFCTEIDKKLSSKAIIIKEKMHKTIKFVIE